jgi:hypothetical protein
MNHSNRTFSATQDYDKQGEREYVPSDKKKYSTYVGQVIDAFVPNVVGEPIFELNEHTFGRKEPVDVVYGPQMSAEVKMFMEYWSIDKLQGRVVLCPVNHRDYELLHLLIELAYEVEGVVGDVKQRVAEVRSVVKGLFTAWH